MGIIAAGQCQQQENREDSQERFHTMTSNPPVFPVKVETRESSLAEPARGPGKLPAGLAGEGWEVDSPEGALVACVSCTYVVVVAS